MEVIDILAEHREKKKAEEIQELKVAWDAASGNISAMGQLGLPRETVQSRLKKYGLFKYSRK